MYIKFVIHVVTYPSRCLMLQVKHERACHCS